MPLGDVPGCATVTCGGSGSWHRPTNLPIVQEGWGDPQAFGVVVYTA
jgi:hypothetical protein